MVALKFVKYSKKCKEIMNQQLHFFENKSLLELLHVVSMLYDYNFKMDAIFFVFIWCDERDCVRFCVGFPVVKCLDSTFLTDAEKN